MARPRKTTTKSASSPAVALFESADAEQAAYEAALAKAEAHRRGKLSKALEAIVKELGKGPFSFKGRVLRIRQRGELFYLAAYQNYTIQTIA